MMTCQIRDHAECGSECRTGCQARHLGKDSVQDIVLRTFPTRELLMMAPLMLVISFTLAAML